MNHRRLESRPTTENYVTAVNGGGMGEDANALRSTRMRRWSRIGEKFRIWFADNGYCYIGTSGAYYLTAVNGGGIAAPAGSPVATDATEIGHFETFTLEEQQDGLYDFKTFDGRYLVAVNGGGMATAGAPLHTDQTQISSSEVFMLVPVPDKPPTTAKLAAIESESCEK